MAIELDQATSAKPTVPAGKCMKSDIPNQLVLVDDEGMRAWADSLISGCPGSEAADFEKLSESIVIQVRDTVNTMTRCI